MDEILKRVEHCSRFESHMSFIIIYISEWLSFCQCKFIQRCLDILPGKKCGNSDVRQQIKNRELDSEFVSIIFVLEICILTSRYQSFLLEISTEQ